MASKRTKKMTVPELHERWARHIGHIAEEAEGMAGHLLRYQAIECWLWQRPHHRRIVNRRSQAFGWISSLWLPVAHMYIRRELDTQNGTVSLNQLFHEIEERPDALPGIATKEVIEDRKAMERQCGGAVEFANHQIAHRAYSEDPFTGGNFGPTFSVFHALVAKYYLLLTATELRSTETKLDPHWLLGFTEAWYKPNKAVRNRFKRLERSFDR